MTASAADVLHSYVLETVGPSPASWPGGYPEEIEAALIDAVFSVRARYGSTAVKTGVVGAVWRWREHRGEPADDLRALARTGPEDLRGLTNSGRLARRWKAEVVVDAARRLVAADMVHANDLREREDAARQAYLSVRGCGPVTWRYLRMLIGRPDVKPDTWVMRFVQDRLPDVRHPDVAAALLTQVAERLDVDVRSLDHAIWNHRRATHPAQAPGS